ncbi:MAG: hydroxyacid dehydrogenase [Dehalobacter sp.]|nr:hydroxyacid dehydrogenase [Dehalobacter sp.]
MKIKTKVLLTQPIHEKAMQLLSDNVEEVLLAPDCEISTLAGLLDEKVEGVIVRYNVFNRELIEKAPNLKVIARHGIGVELIDLKAATEYGVMVVNTLDAATVSVAEHVVLMALMLSKKILTADTAIRQGNYAIKDKYQPDDVEGKTLGLVGLGRIGQEVARRCRGLDMQVKAYDPYLKAERAESIGVSMVSTLEELLRTADIVSLHTPLTEDTRHMIGEQQLNQMKPGAFLINCSRGAVVDEAALIKALECKRIAGAGLDVFEQEPPAKDNPLFSMENVVVSPHSSSLTQNGKVKMAMGAAEQLLQVLRGEVPAHIVNKEVLKQLR